MSTTPTTPTPTTSANAPTDPTTSANAATAPIVPANAPASPTTQTGAAVVSPGVVLACLGEVLAARTGWDEHPDLYLLVGDEAGGVRLEVVELPDEMWAMVPTPVVPLFLAHAIGLVPDARGLLGVALRYESFSLGPAAGVRAATVLRRRAQGTWTPPIAEIPGRVEQRIITAVTPQGDVFMVFADRGEDGTATVSVAEHQGPGGSRYTGTVIDNLAHWLGHAH
ncbi:hypothetical protein [Streptacidiphilus sp. EB129]|uniref:hypothetical protein n=1 Tax=Streptacidiphilus sp. EB129 TaxID=3156262 RepID=UPI003518E94A